MLYLGKGFVGTALLIILHALLELVVHWKQLYTAFPEKQIRLAGNPAWRVLGTGLGGSGYQR
jgi:hypothetical protein